jgi:hypothetical protein
MPVFATFPVMPAFSCSAQIIGGTKLNALSLSLFEYKSSAICNLRLFLPR